MPQEIELSPFKRATWPRHDSETAALIRSLDWLQTSLGPIQTWPQSRKTIIDLMLASRIPTVTFWGRDLIQIYNDEYADLIGATPANSMGMSVRDAWAEAWQVTGPILERALKGETVLLEDEPLAFARCETLADACFASCYTPVPDEDGNIAGVLLTIFETTRRRQEEILLRENAERYRQLSESVPQIVWSSDRDGEVDFFNSRWFDYTGLSAEENYSDAWKRAIHPDDRSRIIAAWSEAVRAGTTALEFEYRLLRKDGVYRWHMDRAVPVKDRQGNIIRWFGTFTDIDHRKRAEEVLRESEERFRQFAENSTAVLWVLDLETMQLEYLSPSFQQVWGAPLDMVPRGLPQWIESVHPDDRDDVLATLNRVRKQGEVVVRDYRVIRPDGTVRWIQNTGFPIFDGRKNVRRIVGIAQDITQHDGSMIYVVDSNEASQRDISLLLQGAGYQVKPFLSARDFLEVAPVLVPGCVVLDVHSNDFDELSIPKELKARRLGLPVVVVGEARGDVAYGVRAMKAGAVDFLDTPFCPERLLDAVASALATIRELAEHDQSAGLAKARIASLSAREREVLNGLLTGGTNKTIARDLDISPRTVEAHRARIMERLDAHSLPELVRIAIAAGLRQ
jgi:PAS domain S-box-containing protein